MPADSRATVVVDKAGLLGGLRIAVVEDDRALRTLLVTLLAARAPRNPMRAAASTISGNGAPKAKIATKDSAAIKRIASFFKARRPTRKTACSTMASTAALSPKKAAATKPTVPKRT